MTEPTLNDLSAYLPALSLRAAAASGDEALPARRRLWGTCLWIDVTGFTALAEHLTKRGPSGIENLSHTINQLYGGISTIVEAAGGDVLFFAGDGALCLWEVANERGLVASASAAIAAAVRVDIELGGAANSPARPHPNGEDGLKLRQVMVTGELTLDTVGGEAGHWLDIVTGPLLQSLGALATISGAGQIVLNRRSVEVLGTVVQVENIGDEGFLLRGARADRVEGTLITGTDDESLNTASVRARVPEFLAQQISEEYVSTGELRNVSVAFVQFKQATTPSFEELHALSASTQRAAIANGGRLYQLVQDDKGIVSVVVFGLPGSGHGEYAVRAVRFAQRIAEDLRDVETRIGVASGSVFCGWCGSDRRRQYCILGNTVIRAARLAERARREPFVDRETFTRACRTLAFANLGPLYVKGIDEPVEAYRAVAGSRRELPEPKELVGRSREVRLLQVSMAAFKDGDAGRVVAVHGEPGTGKSALLSQIPVICKELGLQLHVAVADEVQQHTGYFALRPVMQAWFGLLRRTTDDAGLLAEIEAAAENRELASLLNPLILTNFESTPLVEQMSPETRTQNRKRLVSVLLARALSGRRCAIVIDDAQWLDASSFELIEHLCQSHHNLIWIFGERTAKGTEVGVTARFQFSRSIRLEPLGTESVGQLIASMTGASTVSERLSEVAARAAQGNPLHCIELVRALVTSQRLQVRDGAIDLSGEASSELLDIPATLEELIQSRFDRLSAATRHVLRIASVLGEYFERPVLAEVLRMRDADQLLDHALAEASELGVLRARDDAHEFEHGSIRSVVYRLLLPSEQRLLHEHAALALQSLHPGDEAAIVARLAFHWVRAENAKNAAECSAVAAQQALQGYANADAVYLFSQALEQDHRWRGPLAEDIKRAQWSLALAQALYSQSRHVEARRAYENAIRWTGFAVPGGGLELLFNVVREVSATSGRLLFGARTRALDADLRGRYLAAMRVIHAWGTLDLWEGRLLDAVNKAFIAYRLSWHVASSPEAAEIISGFGYLLASTPARRYSERELMRGVAIADAATDLQAQTSSRVLLGMYYTMVGRTGDARAPLGIAEELADRLGSGLWRHRASFGLGEALLFAGELSSAQIAFTKAARIASAAEPPVEGFANCMSALAALRAGRTQQACETVEGERGVRLVEGECLLLQRFVSLGIHAEVLIRSDRVLHALEVADEALTLSESDRAANVFFAAVHGYTGVCHVFLSCSARQERLKVDVGAKWDRRRLQARTTAALTQLRTLAKMYPAARPRLHLLVGLYYDLRGRLERAVSNWERAETLAATAGQPYERMLAQYSLAMRGPRVLRELRLDQVATLRERFGLTLDELNAHLTEDLV